ncbi:hypothetical protein [Streptomyces sp. NPDC052721]|uniref:hypothetical protein n=1 Tax=Streptomyces sp. NPDC052721 TaxID=3154955 RepID=UPI00342720D9
MSGRLARWAIELVAGESGRRLLVATAAADTGILRFYQRQGSACGPSNERPSLDTGYESGVLIGGVGLPGPGVARPSCSILP